MPGLESMRNRPVAVVVRDAGATVLFDLARNVTTLAPSRLAHTDTVAVAGHTTGIRGSEHIATVPAAKARTVSAFSGATLAGVACAFNPASRSAESAVFLGALQARALLETGNADFLATSGDSIMAAQPIIRVRLRGKCQLLIAAFSERTARKPVAVAVTQAALAA